MSCRWPTQIEPRRYPLGVEELIAESPKAWCVVPDTNAWVSEFGLRSAAGAALIHTLQLRGGVIGFPEVVEAEMSSNLSERGTKAVADTNRNLSQIQMILGYRPEIETPDEYQLRQSVADWLGELEALLVRVPITEDSARDAVGMAISKRAPNHKREEIRDTLIFLACLELAKSYRTVFVTADGDFLEDGEPHPDLAALATERGVSIELDRSIADCLIRIGANRSSLVDNKEVLRSLSIAISNDLAEEVSGYGFDLGDVINERLELFATEDPTHLAVTFELTIELDPDDMNPQEARLIGLPEFAASLIDYAELFVVGSALFEHESGVVTSYNIDSTRYVQYDEAGGEMSFTSHRGSAKSGGNRRIPLTQRYRLAWESS